MWNFDQEKITSVITKFTSTHTHTPTHPNMHIHSPPWPYKTGGGGQRAVAPRSFFFLNCFFNENFHLIHQKYALNPSISPLKMQKHPRDQLGDFAPSLSSFLKKFASCPPPEKKIFLCTAMLTTHPTYKHKQKHSYLHCKRGKNLYGGYFSYFCSF